MKLQAGEPLQITDRGRAVAEIVPARWSAAQPVPPAWAEMIRAFPALIMLSLDERVRRVTPALGGAVLPA